MMIISYDIVHCQADFAIDIIISVCEGLDAGFPFLCPGSNKTTALITRWSNYSQQGSPLFTTKSIFAHDAQYIKILVCFKKLLAAEIDLCLSKRLNVYYLWITPCSIILRCYATSFTYSGLLILCYYFVCPSIVRWRYGGKINLMIPKITEVW